MNICTAANSKYVRYLYVMLTSLLENNADEDIRLYLLHRDLTEADKACVAELMERYGKTVGFLRIGERDFASLPTGKYPLEINFRLALTELLPPSVDRLLYLDVDIIIRGGLRELYDADLGGKAFGACLDFAMPELDSLRKRLFHRDNGDLRYFNSGVMLWDLEQARKKYSFRIFMDAAAALGGSLQYPDQDILNYTVYGDTAYLDGRNYNYMRARYYFPEEQRYAGDALILHYAGCSPWQLGPADPMYEVWWRCAKQTPFYAQFLAEQPGFAEAAIFTDQKNREFTMASLAYRSLRGSPRLRERLFAAAGGYALYGAGVMAVGFLEFLTDEGIDRPPAAIMDACRAGQSFRGLTIRDDFAWAEADREYLLLVTPAGHRDRLAKEIGRRAPKNVRAVPLVDFLQKLE